MLVRGKRQSVTRSHQGRFNSLGTLDRNESSNIHPRGDVGHASREGKENGRGICVKIGLRKERREKKNEMTWRRGGCGRNIFERGEKRSGLPVQARRKRKGRRGEETIVRSRAIYGRVFHHSRKSNYYRGRRDKLSFLMDEEGRGRKKGGVRNL